MLSVPPHQKLGISGKYTTVGGTTQAYEKHLHDIISFISAVLKLLKTTKPTDNAMGIA